MMTKFRLALLATALTLTLASTAKSQDLTLEVTPGRQNYAIGDTVSIGIRASIPPGYHLYSNPLGPGIGKPLNLFINWVNPDGRVPYGVTWLDARKSFPKRYNPPIGSWVWAFESEAYFFVRGVLAKDSAAADSLESAALRAEAERAAAAAKAAKAKAPAAGRKGVVTEPPPPPPPSFIAYEVILEGLICKSACVPVIASAAFQLPLPSDTTKQNAAMTAFPAGSSLQARYSKSEPMAFSAGAPDGSGALFGGGGAVGANTVNLGLAGLAELAGQAPISADAPAGDSSGSNQYGAKSDSLVSADDDAAGVVHSPEGYDYSPLEEKREYSLLTAVLFALFAGLALNLTPCIFPLLGVRVLSFAESARESRRSAVLRSVAFSLGIVTVFLALAALAAFAGFSWGQQFQNPAMLVSIIALVFLFALGLFDFYSLSVPAAVGNAERKVGASLAGDFLKGAIATVMATPCGGPFLGALLAWALTQRPVTIFVLFAVMGVGMALPYVLLSASSRLMSLLPKPGRWIEDLKHVMGFVLLAFAVNMMRSLDQGLVAVAVGVCLSILFAASVHKRFAPFGAGVKRRVWVALISVALIAAGVVASVAYLRADMPQYEGEAEEYAEGRDESQPLPAQWAEFSPGALAAAHAEGRSAVVNFTASWCTNCKLNKAAALNTAKARQLYVDKDVLLLTADLTNRNPEAQELLNHLGSRSVPFLAIFPGDVPGRPVVMRDIISKDRYLKELKSLP